MSLYYDDDSRHGPGDGVDRLHLPPGRLDAYLADAERRAMVRDRLSAAWTRLARPYVERHGLAGGLAAARAERAPSMVIAAIEEIVEQIAVGDVTDMAAAQSIARAWGSPTILTETRRFGRMTRRAELWFSQSMAAIERLSGAEGWS